MRISRSTLVGTAVAVALFGGNAFAQQTSAAPSDANKTDNDTATLQEVVVTGVRYSVQKSIAAKRAATDMTEVATAEDVGKLPAKNVADVLQTLPGVDTSSSVAGEGAFAENDRISLRGTPNSLTQTTIDGHFVSSGDWFIEDQYETVGRSVSYDLLPSEMVGQTVVNLSQNASMIEGGVAGSVDIQTRHPLDFKQGISGYVNGGAEYSDLPAKADPDAQLMVNWNNGSFGVLALGFYSKEDLRRDAQEELGYAKVTPCVAVGDTLGCPTTPGWQLQNPSLPNATGALYPTLLGQTLFQQTQTKKGGLLDIQAKPSDSLSIDLTAFYSDMDAANTNDNYMFWGSHIVEPNYVPTALTIKNGTIVSGTWPTEAGAPASIVYDQITRPGTTADASFVNLDVTFDATSDLTFDGQLGSTLGSGRTTYAPAYEWAGGNGASYTFNGYTSLATVSFPGTATNSPGVNGVNNVGTSWAWNDIDDSVDKETYAKLDATLKQDNGVLEDLKFGVRFAHHSRDGQFTADDGCTSYCWSNMPAYSGGEYPSNFQSGIGASPWGGNIFTYSQSAIDAYDAAALTPNVNGSRYYWLDSFSTVENELAGYVMEDIGGDHWSGNFGVRIVNTLEEVTANLPGIATSPGVETFSAFGDFVPTEIDNRYFNVLPSANLKFDLTQNLVWRFAAAETMALPDPSALGTGVELTDTNETGNGGNANLKPVKGAVYSTDLEEYYGPTSMIEVGLFEMDLSSYVDFGTSTGTYLNMNLSRTTPVYSVFTITSPFNTTAEIRGGTASWQQGLPLGFGVNANFTLANGTSGDGNPVLGDSKYTYNLGAYWQQGPVSANLDYTYRSHYYAAVSESSPQYMANWYNLNAQVSYDITSALSLTLSGRNLTNKIIYEYGVNTSEPVAIYDNGRQYYLSANYKF
ncbi:MAG TPA: TonB-dependent receptor [Steroidobacteraceae bacterium]|nr:TonB-dependent receptor [Steroidobacteraceae bacterium]